MTSRRSFLKLPLDAVWGFSGAAIWLPAACSRRRRATGFRGYAFVANEEGQAIAVVDLEALAVARHIPLGGNPSSVVTSLSRPMVYALTPANGAVHEIAIDTLKLARKLTVASSAVRMEMSPEGGALYVLAKQPRALIRIALDSFHVDWRLALPETPESFAISPDGRTAAVSSASSVRMIDIAPGDGKPKLRPAAAQASFGELRFLSDGRTLVAADQGARRLSLFSTATSQLITHLPLAVRPDHLCFNADGGQLFITGEGMDAVVVVYPYHTPEVAETVLAGHAPGAMAASQDYLFVANPQSGDVSILQINARKVIGVVAVGSDPGYIAVTPDDQYALVLNRQSGDISVLRVSTITRNRDRRAGLLTVIPVGSKPVAAAVRAV